MPSFIVQSILNRGSNDDPEMSEFVETNFDEKSGIVPCKAPWGRWWQTVAELHIEVEVPEGTRAKAISVSVQPTKIKVVVAGTTIIEGKLYSVVREDETLWTLEDKKILHIVMSKADPMHKEKVWEGLLTDNYTADPWVLLEMRKKLDLERFQMENPGFNFSGAQLAKSYDKVSDSEREKWEQRANK
ncbi:nudC domain-containing protein 2-like isoform X2 [Oratosquilla oratoria]|uniref:nudC domain-containing protein 2-like isoform X2 n=1 Tax=Oratosquilla oratoria TaxID=337810 RepID=UPI003F7607EB